MPTVLSTSCINRVAKIKKVRFTSNDLTALKTTPFTLLNLKEANTCRVPFLICVLCDSDADYTGQLTIKTSEFYPISFTSYSKFENYFKLVVSSGSEKNKILLSAEDDFNVGIIRGPVELHIYYYEESVSVPFDFEFVNN